MPTLPPILAEFPGSLFIYLFFGVLWLIGVISERVKKKNQQAARPTRPVPTAEPDSPESGPEPVQLEELERQFRKLMGMQTPEPEPPAPLPPPPLPEPVIQFDVPRGPEGTFEQGGPAPVRTMQSQEDAFAQLADMADIEQVMRESTGNSTVASNPNAFMVNLSKLKMPLIRIPVMSQSHTRTRTSHRDLLNRSILRESIVNNVILGPPKGL